MKNTTLYLLDAEKEAWDALPDERKEGWTVESETLDSFESIDVLKVRAGMARFDTFPALRQIVKSAAAGQKIDLATLKGMPEAVMPELCVTLGAVGVTSVMSALFGMLKTDKDIAALAGFSSIRHDILKTNASVTVSRR